jgi:hypothetical protein
LPTMRGRRPTGKDDIWMTCRVGREVAMEEDVDADVDSPKMEVVAVNIDEEGRMARGTELEAERRVCRNCSSLNLPASRRDVDGIGVEDRIV